MPIALITGSSGLVGSEAARKFVAEGYKVVGIDNDMRRGYFGPEASTMANLQKLRNSLGSKYEHYNIDVRDDAELEDIFAKYKNEIVTVIHAAAQPSHDWAATNPKLDFSVNALGTLFLLELTRKFVPHAVFQYMSTNKVYGDRPNLLPMIEKPTRWETTLESHQNGINEGMSIDGSTHSLFGVSKAAADLLVQEYGYYFGMKTVCFRAGCISGSAHAGAMLHGFLAYLVQCALTDKPYTIYGYKGKQVRDNIDGRDVASALWNFYQKPRVAAVYNIGGGRANSCSLLEAVKLVETATGKKVKYNYVDTPRKGDHIWWISDNRLFARHYPSWWVRYSLETIVDTIAKSIV